MQSTTWLPVTKAEQALGINKKDLFRMRDDGTFQLGKHYASFPETRSRDTYRWNVNAVKKTLATKNQEAITN
jgi:hypothetical protein